MTEEQFKIIEETHIRLRSLKSKKAILSREIPYDTITFSDSIRPATETIRINPKVIADVRSELLKLVEEEIKEVKSDFEKL